MSRTPSERGGASIATSEEEDYYSFKLTERSAVTLTTSGADIFADTVMFLFDSDQNVITYNDDCGSER